MYVLHLKTYEELSNNITLQVRWESLVCWIPCKAEILLYNNVDK